MASVVKIKRSSVSGKIPTISDIEIGELALNINDGKLYSTDGIRVFEVGANTASLKINDAYRFPTSDGTENQVLTTNGSGQLRFSSVSGGAGGGGGGGDFPFYKNNNAGGSTLDEIVVVSGLFPFVKNNGANDAIVVS